MKSEIFEKAQLIIQNRRRNAITENEKRTDEINNKIPQIKVINDTIFNTGQEAVKIIFAEKNKNVQQQKIEKLKRDNLEAQAVSRQLLVANGYPADYLDIHYNCKKCNDTGYFENSMCECFTKLCGKLEADEINKHSQLELSSFDTFSLSYYSGNDYFVMNEILGIMKRYAENFTEHSKSLLISGKTGLGKTHLSLAVANKVLEKGYSVVYDSAINILKEMEKEHFSREHTSEMTDLVMQTDLLILDDLGTEHTTQFYSSTIYNVINTRLNRNKPTIISTNLDNNDIKHRYDERVASRLSTMYLRLDFKGTDVRYQKQREKKNRI
ncbi:MAG: ATP-binding protein [Ruminococcus sp.]|nr:ATP-binding protein [Ruminococcus sp.]